MRRWRAYWKPPVWSGARELPAWPLLATAYTGSSALLPWYSPGPFGGRPFVACRKNNACAPAVPAPLLSGFRKLGPQKEDHLS
jgi:hypothetical protein